MLEFSIYIPRRRAVKNHEPSTITLGIGNMVLPGRYVPLVDIDKQLKPESIEHVVRTGWNTWGYRTGYYVSRTAKGIHVIWHTLVDWKTLNRLWRRLKTYIDRKWVMMQRRRGYAVIRVRGKYAVNDIYLVHEYHYWNNVYDHIGYYEFTMLEKWLKLYRALTTY